MFLPVHIAKYYTQSTKRWIWGIFFPLHIQQERYCDIPLLQMGTQVKLIKLTKYKVKWLAKKTSAYTQKIISTQCERQTSKSLNVENYSCTILNGKKKIINHTVRSTCALNPCSFTYIRPCMSRPWQITKMKPQRSAHQPIQNHSHLIPLCFISTTICKSQIVSESPILIGMAVLSPTIVATNLLQFPNFTHP